MKNVILTLIFANSLHSSYSQSNNDIDNKYLAIVSATMENQVSGANSENSSRMVYDINFKAKNALSLKKISGKISGKSTKGKIIYNNTISDNAIIKEGNLFTFRFEKYNTGPDNENNYENSQIAAKKRKCERNKKNNIDNALIFLSFFIENNQYSLKVRCSKKIISPERLLPQ